MSSQSNDVTPVIKYDRIVSPLDTPAAHGTRSPFDHSFSSLSLGGEAPGWGAPNVYQPSQPTYIPETSETNVDGVNDSPSHSIATVKEDGEEAAADEIDEVSIFPSDELCNF